MSVSPKPAQPSPAAVKLKAARSAFARLRRAAAQDNVDWFEKSLDHMLSNPPSTTCSLYNWHEQIFYYLAWAGADQHRTTKVALMLEKGPTIEPAKGTSLIEHYIRARAYECLPLFHQAGFQLEMNDTVRGYIEESLIAGRWPHLDLLASSFFEDNDRAFYLSSRIAMTIFDPAHYDKGSGFLSETLTGGMLAAFERNPGAIRDIYRRALVSARAPVMLPLQPAPWSRGLAMLVEAKLFSWEQLRGLCPSPIQPLIVALHAESDRIHLENTTPPARSMVRTGTRL